MEHSSGASFHNRYPYSGKIYCEEHGTTFHRQVLKSAAGEKEVWQCKVYRNRGRAACSAPQIRISELDQIMAQIFTELVKDKQAIIDAVLTVVQSVPRDVDYEKLRGRLQEEQTQLQARKDRLLDLSVAGAITVEEFKNRNDEFNRQLQTLEDQQAAIDAQETKTTQTAVDAEKIRHALEEELNFTKGINSNLVATILDRVVVKKGSTKAEIQLDIFLKLGQRYGAVCTPEKSSVCIIPSKNTMPRPRIRRI